MVWQFTISLHLYATRAGIKVSAAMKYTFAREKSKININYATSGDVLGHFIQLVVPRCSELALFELLI